MNYQNPDIPNHPLAQSQKKTESDQSLLAPGIEKTYEKYFKQITELQAGDVIIRHDCKLCNHPLRAEAEAKWEQTKGNSGKGNHSLVLRLLNEKSEDMKFNFQNVSNHLLHHYEQQQRRMWMREYGKRLGESMNQKIEKDKMFEAMTHTMQLKLYEIAANPELDVAKQADIMTRLTKSVLDIQIVQAKLRGDIDTIDVYKQQFHNIVVNLILDERDPERKRDLLERLDTLKEQMIE